MLNALLVDMYGCYALSSCRFHTDESSSEVEEKGLHHHHQKQKQLKKQARLVEWEYLLCWKAWGQRAVDM